MKETVSGPAPGLRSVPGQLVHAGLLECVVNVSEGRDRRILDALATACGPVLLDSHTDEGHHRTVFTLGGEAGAVVRHVQALARASVERLDLTAHAGAHPRLGVLDVVPFVGLSLAAADAAPVVGDDGGAVAEGALGARDWWARWAASELGLPVFLYGPERSLPEVRRRAWRDLEPDFGPRGPHPTAGAVCAGARPVLVAYNVWLEEPDLATARRVAAEVRSPEVRALGLAVGGEVQVSCNLVAPWRAGPAQVWREVTARVPARRGELVGLLPLSVLLEVPRDEWELLGLSEAATIESALGRAGPAGPRGGGPGHQ